MSLKLPQKEETDKILLDNPPIISIDLSCPSSIRFFATNVVEKLLQCFYGSFTLDSIRKEQTTSEVEIFLKSIQNNTQIYTASFPRQIACEIPPEVKLDSPFDKPKDWFIKTADFDDDWDRVLQRSCSEYTELLEDLTHYSKRLQQGYGKIVIFRPPIYKGYDTQLTAAMQCLGYTKDQFQFIIVEPLKLYAFHTPSQKITPIPDLPIDELLKTVEMDDLRWHSLRVPFDSIAPINISSISTPADSLYRVRTTYHHCCELLDRANREGTIQLDTSKPKQWEITNTTQSLSDIDWQDPNPQKLAQLLQTVPNIIEQSAKEIAPHLITQHLENISDVCYTWFAALTPTIETYILLVNLRNTFYELMTEILGISLPVS